MLKNGLTQTGSSAMSQQQLHELIYQELEDEQKNNPMSYMKFANAKGRPYQTYERIGFEGLRWSVEKRIREYGIEKYMQPESVVLDIGSNYGFFVTEFALYTKEAHGVEPVAELCRIGEHTANYLGVTDKVRFFPQKFEDFLAPCQYDTVFTLASFFTSDKNQRSSAESFFGKIKNILKPGGQLFYESTSFQYQPEQEDYEHYIHALEAEKVIREIFSVDDRYEAPSGPQNYRLFMHCRML